MNLRNAFRSPLMWVALAVVLMLVGSNALSSSSAPKKIDTWQMVQTITEGRAKSVVLVDRDQKVTAELTDGSKVRADFIDGQGLTLISALDTAQANGKLPGLLYGPDTRQRPRDAVW